MSLSRFEHVLLLLAFALMTALAYSAWCEFDNGNEPEEGIDMGSYLVRYEARSNGRSMDRAVLVRRAADVLGALDTVLGARPWRDVTRVSVEPAVIVDGLVGVEVLEGVAA